MFDSGANAPPQPAATFRQLSLFEAAGRLGSVARAAEENDLSQPAAAQALALLQSKLGVPLLVGSARGTTLTAAGRDLHVHLSLILRKLSLALRQIGAADSERVIWHLSHDHLRAIHAVAEHGSLQTAAVALGTTRQMLQRSLRRFEQLVGCEILARSGLGTVLTETGRLLARSIGLLSSQIEWMVHNVRKEDADRTDLLTLGVAPDPGTAAVGAAIRAHGIRHPASCVELVEAGQRDLLTRLVIGEIDLLVGHVDATSGEHLAWTAIAGAAFRIVGRPGHPLAGKRKVSLSELLSRTWVLGARGSRRRTMSDALFAGHRPPRCSLITSAAPLIAQVLGESDHLSFMTEQEVARRPEQLKVIPFSLPAVDASLGWARRSDWTPTAAHLDLLDGIAARLS